MYSFESYFNLQELKTADLPQGPETKKQKVEESTLSIFSLYIRLFSSEKPAAPEITEQSITTVMEFMAIPREEALSLLKAYDGNLDNIFASWMT